MQFHIEQSFLCPHCGQVVPVLFCSSEEVTVEETGIHDDNGALAVRQFMKATVCGACGKAFSPFMRVRFYHNGAKATIYDSGKVHSQEIGVAFTTP